jgi:hypothetical protein
MEGVSGLEAAIIKDSVTMIQHDPSIHAELERVTHTILHTAKRHGPAWSVLSKWQHAESAAAPAPAVVCARVLGM